MDKTEKKNVKKPLLLLLACLVVMLACVAVALFLKWNEAEPVMAETGVQLYWNIDRDTYVGDSSAGVNSRERAEDGFYKVRFAVDGEQVEYNVGKARLMHKIDSMDICALAVNEEGTITAVFDPEDVTGGEVASMYYVVFGSDETITVSPNEDLEGDYKILNITEKTGIYNVTGMDPVGYKDSVLPGDCVRSFKNKDGDITHVFIVSRYGYWAGEVVQQICEHCDEVVDWYVWEDKYNLPTQSGHWILENDVKASAQYRVTTDRSIIIDLNGKTITGAEDRRVYAMTGENTYLAFMDSSAEGTGAVVGHGSPDNGGLVLVRYGTFELYSGTLDASDIQTLQFGSAVRVNTGAVFNMYNGTVIGGTALGAMDEEEKSTKGGYGGTIQVGGTFNLYDGVVRDGTALRYDKKDGGYTCGNGGNIHIGTDGVFNMYGGSVLNGTAQRAGGNIFMGKNVVVNISGGTISGGVVMDDDRYGGNIYVNETSQALNISGGTIKDGKTLGAGGNIALYGTLNMSGGTITGGSCMKGETLAEGVHNEEYPHHNIYCAGGTVNMTGGLVEGYFRVRDTSKKECTVNISGTAQIKGGSINLSLDPGDDVNIGILQKGADIRINGGGYVSTETAKANVAYVHSTYEGVETKYLNSKIFIGKQACVCGETENHIGDCDGTILDWIPWGTATSMPNLEANWYLVCDVNMKDQVKIVENATFRLDLNGHKVTGAENMRVYALRNGGINMAITDHSEENSGIIMARGEDMGRGTVVWVSDNGSLKMYGGTLDGSAASTLYNGVTVSVDADCTFVMYDGALVGGTSKCTVDKNGKTINGFGGTLAVSGTFDMYGGKIVDGTCEKFGGNIFVGKTGTFNLRGGEVSGGSTEKRGGNIAGTGNINLYGGLVTNGTAGAAGNILITTAGKLVGGTVSNGTAKHGANILVAEGATWTMSGGSVTGGVATSSNGGNIEVEVNATAKLSGGVVSDGVSPMTGGNIFISGELTMSELCVADGIVTEKDGKGGNIYVNGGTFVMKSGTISGGNGYYGGSVYVSGNKGVDGQMDVYGGTISGGTSVRRGGNIFVGKTGIFNLHDGEVSSGTSASRGGNIAGTGTLNLYGGTVTKGTAGAGGNILVTGTASLVNAAVTDGTAKHGGNVLVEEGAAWTMTGGSVAGGVATSSNGGNIEVEIDATAKLSGGTVSGGVAPASGGNIFVSGELTMSGAHIADGSVTEEDAKGGNIYVNGGNFILQSGTISGGTGDFGGSVAISGNKGVNGQMDMYDGSITGGQGSNNGGNVFVGKTGGFNLHGGEIADGTAGNRGGNIACTGTIHFYGGVVKNGTATIGGNVLLESTLAGEMTGGTISGGIAETHAGNLFIAGQFKMTSGVIADGTVTGETGRGGNIYVSDNASFEMTDGEITGGTSNENGGNVYVKADTTDGTNPGTFVLSGGTVTKGTASQGGNVYLQADSKFGTAAGVLNMSGGVISEGSVKTAGGNVAALGTFIMSGGEIKGGSTEAETDHKYGANVYTVPGKDGCSFTMTGGTITGLVRANNEGVVTLGGTAQITNTDGNTNLTLQKNATIAIDGLEEGAKIGVNPDYDTYFASGAVSGDEAYFTPDKLYKAIEFVEEDKLIIVADWEPWTETDSLPTETGMYYLTENVTITAAAGIENATISLDLRGYTVETSTEVSTIPRIYVLKAGSTLNIYDSSEGETGKIVSHRESSDVGGMIELRAEGTVFNLYGGTLTGGTASNGGCVYVNTGATFNMYGGTLSGGTATDTGGNVYVKADRTNGTNPGVFNLIAGTVTDGSANQGGNVYLQSDNKFGAGAGVLNMSGGEISGGSVNTAGGNVAALGTFIMSGGEIKGGSTNATSDHKYGANVYTVPGKEGCSFTMTGGTIAGLVRANNAGILTLGGSAKITNADGNKNLTLNNNATITIDGLQEGAKIGVNPNYDTYFAAGATAEDVQYFTADDGESEVLLEQIDKLVLIKWTDWTKTTSLPTDSGNYRLTADVNLSAACAITNKTIYLDLNGKTVTAGSAKRALQINTNSVLHIVDTSSEGTGTILGNKSTSDGAVILVYGGSTLNLNQGIVDANGTKSENANGGGVISVRADSTFNMYGGEVKNGATTKNGGNIGVRAGGTFNMYEGTISGGTAGSNGGNIYIEADASAPGVLNIYGGTIKEGTATTAGNIAALGVFNMTGGTIKDGMATGSAPTSGNLYTKPGADGCTFTMTGGTIEGLVRVNNAGTFKLGGTAKVTIGMYNDGAASCGLDVAKTDATMVIDSDGFAEGAEIYLNTNDAAAGTKLVSGEIAEAYQSYFKACGNGTFEFKSDGIYVAE